MEDEELKEVPPVEEPISEPPAEPAPEEAPAPRHALFSRYADKGFKDDSEYLDAALNDLTAADEYKNGNETANGQLVDAFLSEPDLAAVMLDVTKGYSMLQALARNVDPKELQDAIDLGDEELKQSLSDRASRKAEMEAFLSEVSSNTEASKPQIDEFVKNNGWSPEKAQDFLGQANEFLSNIYKGKLDQKTLEGLRRMIEYENDKAEAAEAGEIKGRNENIELKREKASEKGDGLPDIKSAGAQTEAPKKEVHKTGLEDVVDYDRYSKKF